MLNDVNYTLYRTGSDEERLKLKSDRKSNNSSFKYKQNPGTPDFK